MREALTQINIPGVEPKNRGKVRDIYDLDDQLLLVATDRISAFDCVLPQGIPDKGAVLTQLSKFWFETITEAEPHHMISTDPEEFPEPFRSHAEVLRGRSMLVSKAEPFPVECIVRGYLSGSAWVEYQQKQTAGGILLPEGLKESDELPSPIFTPTTKSQEGHDEPISFDEMVVRVGGWEGEELRERSLDLYRSAAKYARERGVIIADTKFEFGILDDEIVLIDEFLTPDSSRFWDASRYTPGRPQEAFDKQFVRDYLLSLDWDKTPPAPDLPEEIILNTSRRYQEAYRMLTGREWSGG